EQMNATTGALAKMIRSDNQRMAKVIELAAQQEAAKQTMRAVKEMEANLPLQLSDLIHDDLHAYLPQLL
ncbi:MAG: hypothetical protein ACO32I_09470, partial [Candidatus Limnocylindrus sp.]